MSNELTLITSTDSAETATAAVNGDEAGARVRAPETVDSYEHPRSERQQLLERLAEAEKELNELVHPGDEPNERIVSSEISDEAPEEAAVTADATQAAAPDDEVIRAVRQQAIADAVAEGRRRAGMQQGAWSAPTQQLPQLSPEQMALHQERSRLLGAFQARIQQMATPQELQEKFQVLQQQGLKDLSPEVYDAMLALRGGPETALHLLKNPSELRKINNMQPAIGAAYVAELGARLTTPRRSVSNAPPPIKPVGGSATKSSLPLDQSDYQTYRRVRDEQERQRYRR